VKGRTEEKRAGLRREWGREGEESKKKLGRLPSPRGAYIHHDHDAVNSAALPLEKEAS